MKAGGAPSGSNEPKADSSAVPKLDLSGSGLQGSVPKVVTKAANLLPPGVVSKETARASIILREDTVEVWEHTRSSFNIWKGI